MHLHSAESNDKGQIIMLNRSAALGADSRRTPARSIRVGTAALVALLCLLALPQQQASATLQLLKPVPSDPSTFFGHGGYSADGLGQNGTGGTIQAEVPAGSTVVQAYLYGTYFFTPDPDLTQRTIDFDGTSVELTKLANSEPGPCCQLSTARADVTTKVAAKVGGGSGITDFAVNSDPSGLDGVGLVVVYSNPALPEVTVAILDGGSKQAGDTATFNFASPLNTSTAGFSAVMSLGSGFSFQSGVPSDHVCGSVQFSTVDVNGSRLTTCAGNYDDGYSANGGLITVGGVGDSLANPPDPNAATGTDDELYNLVPFLHNGDASLTIETTNPSGDDNLFLAVIAITARAAVTTEICNDGIDNDQDGLTDMADPDCVVTPPATTISVSDASGAEGNAGLTPMTFTVSLSQPAPASGVTVHAATADDTATAGSDYQAVADQTITFAAGESSKPFSVQVVGDLTDEPTEAFKVNLSSPANATIADGQGIGTITDDERNGAFSCRATGVRLVAVEVGVANGPNTPCKDGAQTTASVNLSALGLGVKSGTVVVSTDQSPNDLGASSPAVGDTGVANAKVEGIKVNVGLTSITADVVTATAKVECGSPIGALPGLTSSSQVSNVRLNGQVVATGTSPVDVNVPLVGTLHVNHQSVVGGVVVRRAIWLEGKGALSAVQLVVSEAKAGFSGSPCAV